MRIYFQLVFVRVVKMALMVNEYLNILVNQKKTFDKNFIIRILNES